MEANNLSLGSEKIGVAFCPVCKCKYVIDLVKNIDSIRSFRCNNCNTLLKYCANTISLKQVKPSTKPTILSSDEEFKATLAEFNNQADNLRAYFEIMNSRIAAIHNDAVDSLDNPQLYCTTPQESTPFTLITRAEIEEFKREELAKMGILHLHEVD